MADKMVTVQIPEGTRDLLNTLRQQTGRPAGPIIHKALLKLQASLDERYVEHNEWATS